MNTLPLVKGSGRNTAGIAVASSKESGRSRMQSVTYLKQITDRKSLRNTSARHHNSSILQYNVVFNEKKDGRPITNHRHNFMLFIVFANEKGFKYLKGNKTESL